MMQEHARGKFGIARFFSIVILILATFNWRPLQSQVTLKGVWDIHDEFILGAKPPRANDDPVWTEIKPGMQEVFTGKRGQKVLGWDFGPKDGTVILSWHGGPGGGVMPFPWEDYFPTSKTKFRLLIIDQPGAGEGRSEWVPNWLPEDSIEDAITFLSLRGVTGPVIVRGSSWGSTMALLFAQKHPELVRCIVVGAVWANTPAEVKRYLGPSGTKALVPGANQVFASIVGDGKGAAGRIHRAIRDGIGGKELATAYGWSEAYQGVADIDLRKPFSPEPWKKTEKFVMAPTTDREQRFAFIESEMMWRGEQGKWQLRFNFPRSLASKPLIVIQGRYDQVCDPAFAVKVYDAWPGTNKLLIPMNANHSPIFLSNPEDSLKRAGVPHDPESMLKLKRAMNLFFGEPQTMGDAAIEYIVRNEQQLDPKNR